MVVTSGVPTFPHLAAQRPGPAPVCGAWHRLQGFASCPSGHGHRSKLVGGDPQLLAAGGVPWRFMPLCCGSQRGPGCPALPKGRPVAPSGDLWSGCGQCPPPPSLGDPLHSRPATWPAHWHSTQTAARWAPFLPPRPSALSSGACCPKQMLSPLLRRKEIWPQTLSWRPGRTSAYYSGLRMAVTRRCPPGLCLGVLHSVTWPSVSRPSGCAGFWGPVGFRVHVCLRDVRDWMRMCAWGPGGPTLEPCCPHGARGGRTFSVTYLPAAPRPCRPRGSCDECGWLRLGW